MSKRVSLARGTRGLVLRPYSNVGEAEERDISPQLGVFIFTQGQGSQFQHGYLHGGLI